MDQKMSYDPAADGWTRDERDPYCVTAGPIWTRLDGDRWRYGVLVEQKHANKLGIVHGGLPLLLADHALGDWLMHDLMKTGGACVTVDVSLQFLGPVKVGEFVECHHEAMRITNSLAFMHGRLMVGDRMTHNANGVWKIRRGKPT